MTRADSYFVVCKAERRGSIPSQSDRCCVARATRRDAKDIRRGLCYSKLNKYRPCRLRTPARDPVHLFLTYTSNTMARVRNTMARVRNTMACVRNTISREFEKKSVIKCLFRQHIVDTCQSLKINEIFGSYHNTCRHIIRQALKKRSGARAEKVSSKRKSFFKRTGFLSLCCTT